MIIKSLLFIIILIFVYETINKLYKLQEEYFITQQQQDNNYNDNKDTFIPLNNGMNTELDTPYHAQYKPLEYNPKRLYYYRRDILIPEGKRRNKDDKNEIKAVKNKYALETDITKKEILQDELDLFNWRAGILAEKDEKVGTPRSIRDITTDYYPAEIGMQRIWREPHSHIRDYSNELNYGYDAYSSKPRTSK